MAGKWHLGQTKEQLPASQWFEDSVLLGEGGGADSILYPILFSALGANPLGASLSAKYAFTEASISAREARGRSLRQIEAKPFALVVAEIQLAGALDGVTTMRLARAKRPRLKCLFTSAFVPARLWGDDELDDFIAKPLDRRELLGCVFELLERAAPLAAAIPWNVEHRCA
jgi:hypothetical protein